MLHHDLWQSRFGGSHDVLGSRLELEGRTLTVVGVMPPGFHPPSALYQGDVQLWFPLARVDDDLTTREAAFLQGIARLREEVSVEEARAELQALSAADPALAEMGVLPLKSVTVGDAGHTLAVLLAAVGFLLLVACANVANLFLVRATERTGEMALRTAMGAGRGRIARQLLTEGLLLAIVGGVLGVLLAYLGVEVFRATNPGDLPRLDEVTVDLRVVALTLGLAVSTGLVFGSIPLIRRGRRSPADSLGGTRSSAGVGEGRLRGALVIGQTAVALVLASGAGLLVRSFVELNRIDPGFDPSRAVWIEAPVPAGRSGSPGERLAYLAELERALRGIPGVAEVGATENLPMGGNGSAARVFIEGAEVEEPPAVSFHSVTPGFLEAIAPPVLRGRLLSGVDREGAPLAAVINESMAARFWPGEDAIGRRLRLGSDDPAEPSLTVVGVVGDVRQMGLGAPVESEMYISWLQDPGTNLSWVARSDREPGALLRDIKEAVWSVAPTMPIDRFGSLEDHVSASLVEPRFYTLLFSSFAAVALALAMVGLYATLSYTVEQRRRELGVRSALGADGGRLLALVVRRGMALVLVGVVLGVTGAIVTGKALERFIFGIPPSDPATLAVVAVLMAGAALLSCWLPARRATRIDRCECSAESKRGRLGWRRCARRSAWHLAARARLVHCGASGGAFR